jgi:hypothetical protein
MRANCQAASAFAGWPAPGLNFARPRSLGTGWAAAGAVAAVLLRGRQWLEVLKQRRCRGPGRGDGPQEPSHDRFDTDSIWDDPELWLMIMMH